MRFRSVLPIKLYSSSSITLNERFRRLEHSTPRRGRANPLGIRHTNVQRRPVALRLGQKFSISGNRGRPPKIVGRTVPNYPIVQNSAPTRPVNGSRLMNFRGGVNSRGRSAPPRGRGTSRALAKRRRTGRFTRGGTVNPQQLRANLDKELSEYMDGK